jgi:hypothetical protein
MILDISLFQWDKGLNEIMKELQWNTSGYLFDFRVITAFSKYKSKSK